MPPLTIPVIIREPNRIVEAVLGSADDIVKMTVVKKKAAIADFIKATLIERIVRYEAGKATSSAHQVAEDAVRTDDTLIDVS